MTTRLKVGALAKRTGVTVRTLHHYDDIGLLSPSGRTPSGHRLYDEADVARLQQIASLRHLGLPLDEIRACLARPDLTLERALELQIERIEEQIEHHVALRDRVRALRDRLGAAEEVSVEELMRTISLTFRYERYYTSDQLDTLRSRRDTLGEERIREVERAWTELFEAFGRALHAGLDEGSEEVRALARRADELVGSFTGGDAGIERSLSAMYAAEGGPNVLSDHGLDVSSELWSYMARAHRALRATRAPRSDGSA